MKPSLKKRLVAGETLIGTVITLPSPEIAEILAAAGFDWLFVDLEHSALDFQSAQALLQAAGNKIFCVIRCPSNEEVWIKKSLDLGADGLIIPQVRSAQDAERAVQFSRYPPLGARSVGMARAQGYGQTFQHYIDSANDDIALILQAEHIEAIANIASILQVPGIDCVFVGPYDLSGSMGKIGQVTDPGVLEAIAAVRQACLSANVPLGIFGATPDSVRPYISQGFKLIAVGIDVMVMGSAARSIVRALRS